MGSNPTADKFCALYIGARLTFSDVVSKKKAWAVMTVWPSGLRRWLKAPFRKGVGSNPTGVILKKCIAWVRTPQLSLFYVCATAESQEDKTQH